MSQSGTSHKETRRALSPEFFHHRKDADFFLPFFPPFPLYHHVPKTASPTRVGCLFPRARCRARHVSRRALKAPTCESSFSTAFLLLPLLSGVLFAGIAEGRERERVVEASARSGGCDHVSEAREHSSSPSLSLSFLLLRSISTCLEYPPLILVQG